MTSAAHTDPTVDLAWDPSTDDGGRSHYTVYVDGATWDESIDTTAQVTGLTAKTTYDFHVTTVDTSGNESDPSNNVAVTTDASSTTAHSITSFTAIPGRPDNLHAEDEMAWEVAGSPTTVMLALYEGSIETDEASYRSWDVASSGSKTFQEKFASAKTYTDRRVTTTDVASVEAIRTVDA